MARPPIANMEDMRGFLELLEHARLELLETVIARADRGYNDEDLQKLALHGSAIQSVKDAIAFRKKFDGL